MTSLRIATFNCENLMMRCDFSKAPVPGMRDLLKSVGNADQAQEIDRVFNVLSEDDRTLTAQALAATRADICALQEVENLVVLTAFHNRYLRRWTRRGYPHRVLVEGNDTRGIDVGCLSRLPIRSIVSHAEVTFEHLGIAPPAGVAPKARIFRRDCLQVEVDVGERSLTLFICHFKSMHGGRSDTAPVRLGEALGVRAIIEATFDTPEAADWIVLGDFNDYFEEDGESDRAHSLTPLLAEGFSMDAAIMSIDDPLDRWSHHFNRRNAYTALDHIFLSPAIAERNPDPDVRYVRAGLPWRTERYTGFRLPGVGWDVPKASDHCPLVATIEI